MRVFKNAWFIRFARKQRISDSTLRDAVARAESGLIDADLGGGVIKQRVPRAGGGRSGGYRTLILFRTGQRAIFAFGFAKSEMANIDRVDGREFKMIARLALGFTEADMDRLVSMGEFEEIAFDGPREDS